MYIRGMLYIFPLISVDKNAPVLARWVRYKASRPVWDKEAFKRNISMHNVLIRTVLLDSDVLELKVHYPSGNFSYDHKCIQLYRVQ